MDPLTILREFSISSTLGQVTEDGRRIYFGDRYSFPKVRDHLALLVSRGIFGPESITM